MRWFWIDRFTEFVSGQHAVAVKNVCLAEPYVLNYAKKFSSYPPSLVVEGLAQTGGILVNQTFNFQKKVVLAKLGKVVFHDIARPGDQLTYHAEVQTLQDDGAMVECKATKDGKPFADANLMFAYPEDQFKDKVFFEDVNFSAVMRSLRVFDVGVSPDGTPIEIPEYLLQSEQEFIENSSTVGS